MNLEMNNMTIVSGNIFDDARKIVETARREAYAAINQTMVSAYWQLGKRIVEEEQNGKNRAEYGKQLLKQFGKGFSVQNLYGFRQFYLTFPEIFSTPWRILTWSHYKRIMHIQNEDARNWYLKEASEQMWSYATLNRNISTMYYERLLMSQQRESVAQEMYELTKDFDKDKLEFIKSIDFA